MFYIPSSLDEYPKNKTENTKIFVNKLNYTITSEHLEEIFGYYGKILSIYYPKSDKQNFAVIEFDEKKCCIEAIECMNGGEIDRKMVDCEYFDPKKHHRKKDNPKRGRSTERSTSSKKHVKNDHYCDRSSSSSDFSSISLSPERSSFSAINKKE